MFCVGRDIGPEYAFANQSTGIVSVVEVLDSTLNHPTPTSDAKFQAEAARVATHLSAMIGSANSLVDLPLNAMTTGSVGSEKVITLVMDELLSVLTGMSKFVTFVSLMYASTICWSMVTQHVTVPGVQIVGDVVGCIDGRCVGIAGDLVGVDVVGDFVGTLDGTLLGLTVPRLGDNEGRAVTWKVGANVPHGIGCVTFLRKV